MLGTVEFGLPYGIANRTGPAVVRVARESWHLPMMAASTAWTQPRPTDRARTCSAGAHELGLGEQDIRCDQGPGLPGGRDLGHGRRSGSSKDVVHSSLQRLQLDRLAVCLFHRGRHARHMDALLELKDRGMIGQVGVSVDAPGDALPSCPAGRRTPCRPRSTFWTSAWSGRGVRRRYSAGARCCSRAAPISGLDPHARKRRPAAASGTFPVRRALGNRGRGRNEHGGDGDTLPAEQAGSDIGRRGRGESRSDAGEPVALSPRAAWSRTCSSGLPRGARASRAVHPAKPLAGTAGSERPCRPARRHANLDGVGRRVLDLPSARNPVPGQPDDVSAAFDDGTSCRGDGDLSVHEDVLQLLLDPPSQRAHPVAVPSRTARRASSCPWRHGRWTARAGSAAGDGAGA